MITLILHVILERTDIIQITNITCCYNRFSILTNSSLKSMGRFRIQLLLKDNTWGTKFHMSKNSKYSSSSTEWSLLNLDFTDSNYGMTILRQNKYGSRSCVF